MPGPYARPRAPSSPLSTPFGVEPTALSHKHSQRRYYQDILLHVCRIKKLEFFVAFPNAFLAFVRKLPKLSKVIFYLFFFHNPS